MEIESVMATRRSRAFPKKSAGVAQFPKPRTPRKKLLSIPINGSRCAKSAKNSPSCPDLSTSKTLVVTRARRKLGIQQESFNSLSETPPKTTPKSRSTAPEPCRQKRGRNLPVAVPLKKPERSNVVSVTRDSSSDISIDIPLLTEESDEKSLAATKGKKRSVNRSPWVTRKRRRYVKAPAACSTWNVVKLVTEGKSKSAASERTVPVDESRNGGGGEVEVGENRRRSGREFRPSLKFLEYQQIRPTSSPKRRSGEACFRSSKAGCKQEVDVEQVVVDLGKMVEIEAVKNGKKESRRMISGANSKANSREMDSKEVQKYIILEHSFLGSPASGTTLKSKANKTKKQPIQCKNPIKKLADWFCEVRAEGTAVSGDPYVFPHARHPSKLESLDDSDEEPCSMPMMGIGQDLVGKLPKQTRSSRVTLASYSNSSRGEGSIEPASLTSIERASQAISLVSPQPPLLSTQSSVLSAATSPESWHSASDGMVLILDNVSESSARPRGSLPHTPEPSIVSFTVDMDVNHDEDGSRSCSVASMVVESASADRRSENEVGHTGELVENQLEKVGEPRDDHLVLPGDLPQELVKEAVSQASSEYGPSLPSQSGLSDTISGVLPQEADLTADVLSSVRSSSVQTNPDASEPSSVVKILQYNKTAHLLRVEMATGEVVAIPYEKMKEKASDQNLLAVFLDGAYQVSLTNARPSACS